MKVKSVKISFTAFKGSAQNDESGGRASGSIVTTYKRCAYVTYTDPMNGGGFLRLYESFS